MEIGWLNDFEIILASETEIWNYDVLERLWNWSNPKTTFNFQMR